MQRTTLARLLPAVLALTVVGCAEQERTTDLTAPTPASVTVAAAPAGVTDPTVAAVAGPAVEIQATASSYPRGVAFTVTPVYRDAKGAIAKAPQPLQLELSMRYSGGPSPDSPPPSAPFTMTSGTNGAVSITGHIEGTIVARLRMGATLETSRSFAIVIPPIAKLALSPRTQTITAGATGSLKWSITDSVGKVNNNVGLRLTSLNPAVALVGSDGKVQAVAPGTTKIVLMTFERTTKPLADSATITVVAPVLASLALTAGQASLPVGWSDSVRVRALDAKKVEMKVPQLTWTSSAPTVAKVSASGLVTALAVGKATITAIAPGGKIKGSVAYTVVATPPAGSGMAVTVRYIGTPSPAVQAVMQRVVARWQSVIAAGGAATYVSIPAGACFTNSPAVSETVQGMLLFVRSGVIDGDYKVLARAGPCALRTGARGLPIVASILFDDNDLGWMSSSGEWLFSTALHETGHALGIGTLWGIQQPLLAEGLDGSNPLFTGSAAKAAFTAIGGARISTSGVPIENTAGRGAGGHWRMSTFGAELMVGVLQSGAAVPLSGVTVGALSDMGYQVRPSAADAYTLPDAAAATRMPSISARDIGAAVDDVVEPPRFSIDAATGRPTPLTPNGGRTRARQ